MDILFRTKKLAKEFNDTKLLVRRHGTRRAQLIRRRLDDLKAAENLEIMRTLPGRCHELTADWSGFLSVDLDHPWRLIFRPKEDPIPLTPSGGLDWSRVKSITIEGIFDTHG